MADHKYYWIKLKDTMFTSDAIDFLMGQPNGANYVVLYQMLCLKTIKTNGELCRHIGEMLIPYDVEKIQRDCKYFSIDTVRMAMGLYQQLGLIFTNENGNLQISNFSGMVGCEGASAERMRALRERQKASQCDNKVTGSVTQDKDKDKDKEIEKKIYINKENAIAKENSTATAVESAKKQQYFKPPTVEEVKEYCKERRNGIDAEEFCDFYKSKGWYVGANKMKDWKSAVRTWEKKRKADKTFAERDYTESDMNSVFTDLNNYDDIEL